MRGTDKAVDETQDKKREIDSSWLNWMTELQIVATPDCDGPAHCMKYGQVTIRSGLARAAKDPEFKLSWARWVLDKTANANDMALNAAIIALFRRKGKTGERHLVKLARHNPDIAKSLMEAE